MGGFSPGPVYHLKAQDETKQNTLVSVFQRSALLPLLWVKVHLDSIHPTPTVSMALEEGQPCPFRRAPAKPRFGLVWPTIFVLPAGVLRQVSGRDIKGHVLEGIRSDSGVDQGNANSDPGVSRKPGNTH